MGTRACEVLPVALRDGSPLPKSHGIAGFEALKKQMEEAYELLHRLAPNTPLPVEGGLLGEELVTVLESLAPSTVGMGIYEYAPAGERMVLIERILELGLGI